MCEWPENCYGLAWISFLGENYTFTYFFGGRFLPRLTDKNHENPQGIVLLVKRKILLERALINWN